jgi:hypothetical protein
LHGLSRTPVSGANPTVPGDQAYAYMVAMTIAENVWEELHGSKLTIANYLPRNGDQRNALWYLTEGVFIPSGFSLKELIAQITTGKFFNRAAPDVSGGLTPYRMPMIFDPWVERDPRPGADPNPDPQNYNNGEGERIHRYSPRTLLNSISVALGWPGPRRFPDPSAYPNRALASGIGQYISDIEQGTKSVDFQGLLTWESSQQGANAGIGIGIGNCDKPAGVLTDWVDRLIAGIPNFNAAHPLHPLTIEDLVLTMKDGLIGQQSISSVMPTNPSAPVLTEEAALAALFGNLPLNSSTSAVLNLADKARTFCGVLVKSAHFMLAGLEFNTGLTPLRYRVCNGAPCTYAEFCAVYQSTLYTMGHYIECGNHFLWLGTPPPPDQPSQEAARERLCPRNACVTVSSQAAAFCERNPDVCLAPLPSELLEPVGCGPRGCPPRWFDISKPALLVMQAEGAPVDVAQNVEIKPRGDKAYRALKQGETLRAGDLLRLRPGAMFEAKAGSTSLATPKIGMPSKFAGSQRPIDLELMDAAERGRPFSVAALLDKRANIETRDRFGRTPLMKAAAAGNLAMVELLLKRGATLEAEDTRGLTAADFATMNKRNDTATLLARHGLPAKDASELAKSPDDVEEPWTVLIAGEPPPSADRTQMTPRTAWDLTQKGVLGAGTISAEDLRKINERIRMTPRHGEGGEPPVSVEEAREQLQLYRERSFAREHRNLMLRLPARPSDQPGP